MPGTAYGLRLPSHSRRGDSTSRGRPEKPDPKGARPRNSVDSPAGSKLSTTSDDPAPRRAASTSSAPRSAPEAPSPSPPSAPRGRGQTRSGSTCPDSTPTSPGTRTASAGAPWPGSPWPALEVAGGTAAVIVRIGPVRQRLAAHPVPPGPVTLAVDMRRAGIATAGRARHRRLLGRDSRRRGPAGRTGRPLSVHGSGRRVHRPCRRHVRHGRARGLRLVRLRAASRCARP